MPLVVGPSGVSGVGGLHLVRTLQRASPVQTAVRVEDGKVGRRQATLATAAAASAAVMAAASSNESSANSAGITGAGAASAVPALRRAFYFVRTRDGKRITSPHSLEKLWGSELPVPLFSAQ